MPCVAHAEGAPSKSRMSYWNCGGSRVIRLGSFDWVNGGGQLTLGPRAAKALPCFSHPNPGPFLLLLASGRPGAWAPAAWSGRAQTSGCRADARERPMPPSAYGLKVRVVLPGETPLFVRWIGFRATDKPLYPKRQRWIYEATPATPQDSGPGVPPAAKHGPRAAAKITD